MITRGVSGQPVAGKPVSGFPAGDFPLEEGVDAPSWLLLYSADATSVLVGDTVHFTMTIRNRGTLEATTVVIENIVSAEFNNILNLTSTAGTPSLLGNTITLNLASIASATEVVIEFDADAVSAGTPEDRYTVDCAELPQALSAGIQFDIQVPAPIWQDFLLSIDPTTFGIGETSSVSISFTNVGNSPATNVVMDCPIPVSLGNIQNLLSTHGTPAFSVGSVTLSLASVPAAQTTTITFDMDGVSAASPTIQATLDSTELVQELSNSIPLTITSYSTTRVLSADAATVNPGDILEYTVLITNTGANDLTNSVYTDLLSDLDLTLVPGSVTTTKGTIGSDVTVDIGTLLTTDAVTITYQATVNAAITPPDTVSTQGTLTTTELGAQSTNQIDVSVEAVAAVVWDYSLSINPSTLNVGETTDFTLVIENTGNTNATNTQLSIDLKSFLGNVTSLSSTHGTTEVNTGIIYNTIGTVPPGQVTTLTFTAEALTQDQQTLTGFVTSNQIGGNTNSIQVTTSHVYSSTRTLLSNVVGDANPGDTITYTATITNTGTDSLTLSVYEDELTDANLTVVSGSATTDKGTVTQDDTRIEIALGTFSPAESAIITYQVLIAAGMTVPGTVSAQGTLTTSQLGAQTTNQVTDNVVEASTGPSWTDLTSSWPNMDFNVDSLSAGSSVATAANWTSGMGAINQNDGFGVLIPPNMGMLADINVTTQSSGNITVNAGDLFRVSLSTRRSPPASDRRTLELTLYGSGTQIINQYYMGDGALGAVNDLHTGGVYLAQQDALSDNVRSIGLRPSNNTVTMYVDGVKVEKFAGTDHLGKLFPQNGVGAVAKPGYILSPDPYVCWYDTATYPPTLVENAKFLVGWGMAYKGTLGSVVYEQTSDALRPILTADGAWRFDGIDDRIDPVLTQQIFGPPWTSFIRLRLRSNPAALTNLFTYRLTPAANITLLRVNAAGELQIYLDQANRTVVAGYVAAYVGVDHIIKYRHEANNHYVEIIGGSLAGTYPIANAAQTGFFLESLPHPSNSAPIDIWNSVAYGGAEDTGLDSRIPLVMNNPEGT